MSEVNHHEKRSARHHTRRRHRVRVGVDACAGFVVVEISERIPQVAHVARGQVSGLARVGRDTGGVACQNSCQIAHAARPQSCAGGRCCFRARGRWSGSRRASGWAVAQFGPGRRSRSSSPLVGQRHLQVVRGLRVLLRMSQRKAGRCGRRSARAPRASHRSAGPASQRGRRARRCEWRSQARWRGARRENRRSLR